MPWRGPCYRLMGWRAGIPPPGETGGKRESCKGRDGHPSGRRGPCLPTYRLPEPAYSLIYSPIYSLIYTAVQNTTHRTICTATDFAIQIGFDFFHYIL